jgi:hypothetical protein
MKLENDELGEFIISTEEWKIIEQLCHILEVSLFIYLFI